eukprot:COSAG02_NODE_5669_length_4142_cov_2.620084_1_plen_148_part_10
MQIAGDEPHQAPDQPFDKTGQFASIAETPPAHRSPAAVHHQRAHLSSSSDDDSERLFDLSEREEEVISVVHDRRERREWRERRERRDQHRQSGQRDQQPRPETTKSTGQGRAAYLPWHSNYHDPLEDTSPLSRLVERLVWCLVWLVAG